MRSAQCLRPWDFFQIMRKHHFEEFSDLVAWAQSQQRNGCAQYLAFMAKQGPKMPVLFKSWKTLQSTPFSQQSLREQRLRFWNRALSSPCSCTSPGRLRHGVGQRFETLLAKFRDLFGDSSAIQLIYSINPSCGPCERMTMLKYRIPRWWNASSD